MEPQIIFGILVTVNFGFTLALMKMFFEHIQNGDMHK